MAMMFAPRDPLGISSAADLMRGPYSTPGIGDDIPGNIPSDPRIAQAMKPGMFGRGGRGWQILGTIGDALQVAGGGRATYADEQRHWADMEAERQQRMEELAAKRGTPTFINARDGIYSGNPETGELTQLHAAAPDAPDFDAYARLFGQPGTPEYNKAAQEFTLKGNSEGVLAAKQQAAAELAALRFNNSVALKRTPGAGAGGGAGQFEYRVNPETGQLQRRRR